MVGYYLISKFTFQVFNLVLNAHEHEKHIYEFIYAWNVIVSGFVTSLEAPSLQILGEAGQYTVVCLADVIAALGSQH